VEPRVFFFFILRCFGLRGRLVPGWARTRTFSPPCHQRGFRTGGQHVFVGPSLFLHGFTHGPAGLACGGTRNPGLRPDLIISFDLVPVEEIPFGRMMGARLDSKLVRPLKRAGAIFCFGPVDSEGPPSKDCVGAFPTGPFFPGRNPSRIWPGQPWITKFVFFRGREAVPLGLRSFSWGL